MIDRPDTSTLALAIAFTAAGWLLDAWNERSSRTEVAPSESDRRPDPIGAILEPPAVVGLLTNRFEVPTSAVTATVLDLAARDWIGIGLSDGELVVVARGQGQVGDTLRPFEQQVLNHLSSRAFNGVSSAATLAASQDQLDWRWWIRFRRSVAQMGQELGLTEDRYTVRALAPPAACAAIGLIVTLLSIRHGVAADVSDSWKSRLVWLIALGAAGALAWRVFQRAAGAAQQPTGAGAARTSLWYGYRRRLLAKVPPDASVIGTRSQQATLANAVVMGVAEPILDELPAAPEDHHSAWSEAGEAPHLVTVRYPIRPGYGQHPGKVLAAGVVVLLLARWVRAFLVRVADGDALQSLIERAPGQIDVIEKIARTLAVLCWIPILWAVWSVVAGAVDSIATRERVGSVVRARKPIEVLGRAAMIKPFAERDRASTYLAVDDGRRRVVTAWLANQRRAAPQGAQARVRATPLLGYVRSSEPIGTGTRTGV